MVNKAILAVCPKSGREHKESLEQGTLEILSI